MSPGTQSHRNRRPGLHICACIVLALFFVGGASPLTAKEEVIDQTAVPHRVLEEFARAFPKAHVEKCTRLVDRTGERYDIESIEDGLVRTVRYLPDGTTVHAAEVIPPMILPEAVKRAMFSWRANQKTAARGEVLRVERLITAGKTTFIITMFIDGKKRTFEFNPDGTTVERAKHAR